MRARVLRHAGQHRDERGAHGAHRTGRRGGGDRARPGGAIGGATGAVAGRRGGGHRSERQARGSGARAGRGSRDCRSVARWKACAALTNGRGVDCAIVAAASKSPAPAQHALSLCRDRGRICIVGAVGMEFPWNDMYLKEIQLYMSRAYGPGSYDASYEKQGRDYPLPYVRWTENRNMEEFLRLVATGRIDVAPADHARVSRWTKRRRRTTPSSTRRRRAWRCCCAIPRPRAGPGGGIRAGQQGGDSRARAAQQGDASNSPWWGRAIWPNGSTCRISRNCRGGAARGVLGGRGAGQELRATLRRLLRLLGIRRGAARSRRWMPC